MDGLSIEALVVPRIDAEALKRIGQQIRMTVAQAVHDGINDAQRRESASDLNGDQYDSFTNPAAFDTKLKNERTA